MSTKPRSADQTATSFSVEKDLLADIDKRASDLGLTRSKYLATLARNDIAEGGDLLLRDSSKAPAPIAPEKTVRYKISGKPRKKVA